MKRIELFEFEDFSWLPHSIRTGVTNLILIFHKIIGTAEVLSQLIIKAKENADFDQVIDLGSGSGGPTPNAVQQLNSKGMNMKLVLTDIYPNPKIVEAVNSQGLAHLKYHETAVDATDIGHAPAGLKTMIASFHHMNPSVARKILFSAQEGKEPILIYEMAKNNIPLLLWCLFLPISLIILFIMALVMTPFVRPLTFNQVIFTYLIPIIPIVYAWDGQASLMRTYTFDDIKSMLGEATKDYTWIMEDAKKANGKKAGYYVMGYSSEV